MNVFFRSLNERLLNETKIKIKFQLERKKSEISPLILAY